MPRELVRPGRHCCVRARAACSLLPVASGRADPGLVRRATTDFGNIYSLRNKINTILRLSTQINVMYKIVKIFFVLCDEWMMC